MRDLFIAAVTALADSIPSVYRPPGARGQPGRAPMPLHNYEPPSNQTDRKLFEESVGLGRRTAGGIDCQSLSKVG